MNRLLSGAAHAAGFLLVFAVAAGSLLLSPANGLFAAAPRFQEKDKPKDKETPQPKETEKKDQPKEKPPALPLKSNRTIEFTTDEGTWVSLDVAPDGKTIVLDLLGDLYTIGIEGGEARAITTGPAFDSSPRFSPDGNSIAFVSDHDGRKPLDRRQRRHGRPAAFQGQAIAVRLAVVDA